MWGIGENHCNAIHDTLGPTRDKGNKNLVIIVIHVKCLSKSSQEPSSIVVDFIINNSEYHIEEFLVVIFTYITW